MAVGKRGAIEQINRQENTIKALELRKAGQSYRAIAEALNISLSTAHAYVTEALAELKAVENDTALELRVIVSQRLETAYEAIQERVEQGELVAIDRQIKILQTFSQLWGLNATITQDLRLMLGNGEQSIPVKPDYRAGMAALAPASVNGDDSE